MTYVIGDVHGDYDTLLELTDRLPRESKLIFTGDLIDRGEKSKEVVNFVKENNHKSVMGNHEMMMFTYGRSVLNTCKNNAPLNHQYLPWYQNGGTATLLSYGLIKIIDGQPEKNPLTTEKELQEFEEDIMWMESLPLYIETGFTKNEKPVVVSHGSIDSVWELRNAHREFKTFYDTALTSRKIPNEKSGIYNIYGHTPQKNPDTSLHYLNIDTGCYKKDPGYGRLSAYSLETNEVISVRQSRIKGTSKTSHTRSVK